MPTPAAPWPAPPRSANSARSTPSFCTSPIRKWKRRPLVSATGAIPAATLSEVSFGARGGGAGRSADVSAAPLSTLMNNMG
jgi:hypothetical protein